MSDLAGFQPPRIPGMKLGIIHDTNFVLSDPDCESWAIHNFTISGESLSFSEIFDSAFATPARYVEEIFARLCSLEGPGREAPKFIFNPLYRTTRLNIALVVAAVRKIAPAHEMAVLSDDKGLPVGYLLPAWLKSEDSRFLALLSTVHGTTDAELLQRVYFAIAPCIPVNGVSLKWSGHNSFQYEGNLPIYRWIADRAIKMLDSHVRANDSDEARRQRDAIPFTAVMTHHAGDLLFFIVAFNHLQPPISRLVTNKAYVDMVADNAPGLEVLPISLPLVNRGEDFQRGNVTPDHAYFEQFCNQLPEDSFYGYHRASRDCSTTKLHFIDHFIFALGGRLASRSELQAPQKSAPDLFTPEPPGGPRKILLHFDGGWPMKIYAKDKQEQLIDLLCAKGYSVTVLAGTQYDHPKCRITTFKSYGQLVELLRSHHLLVGMDSFPVHYAVYVLGLPTICLFASTRPENARAQPAPNYSALEQGLRCRPCAALVRCPLYGVPYCRNFVDPETVAAEVERMLAAATTGTPVPYAGPATFPGVIEDFVPLAKRKPHKTKSLSLKYLWLKSALAWPALPHNGYVFRLYAEFYAVVESDGLLLAMLRTLRFLRKSLRL
jgi:hypothetical protein